MSDSLRRRTLATINPNTLDAARGNAEKGGVNKKHAGRMSMMPLTRKRSNSMNRSSLGGRNSFSRRSSVFEKGSRKVQDPRPIFNKAHQQESIKLLISFLIDHQFPMEISQKMLASPSTHHFVNISLFLLQHIDENFYFEDWQSEISDVFSFLGYPFKIRKQTLQNVGSPHAWPSLLAALMWLVELINYRESTALQKPKGTEFSEEEALDTELMFMEYVQSSYGRFMQGEDMARIEEDLFRLCNEKTVAVQSYNEKLQHDKAQFKDRISELESEKQELESLVVKKQRYSEDLQKIGKGVEKLNNAIFSISTQLSRASKQLDLAQQDQRTIIQTRDQLLSEVDQQELSIDDVSRISRELKMYSDIYDNLSAEEESIKSRMWDLEEGISKTKESLERQVAVFNAKTSHLFSDETEELKVSCSRGSQQMLSIDLKNDIKPMIHKMKAKLDNQKNVAQKEVRQCTDTLKRIEELHREKQLDLGNYKERLDKLEATCDEESKQLSLKLKEAVQKVEDIELNLITFGDKESALFQECKDRYDQREEEMARLMELLSKEEDAMVGEIMHAVEALIDQKVHISDAVESLHNLAKEIHSSINPNHNNTDTDSQVKV